LRTRVHYSCKPRHISLHSFLAFFSNHTSPTALYTLSLHDALPICPVRGDDERGVDGQGPRGLVAAGAFRGRSESSLRRRRPEHVRAAAGATHTSELRDPASILGL